LTLIHPPPNSIRDKVPRLYDFLNTFDSSGEHGIAYARATSIVVNPPNLEIHHESSDVPRLGAH